MVLCALFVRVSPGAQASLQLALLQLYPYLPTSCLQFYTANLRPEGQASSICSISSRLFLNLGTG